MGWLEDKAKEQAFINNARTMQKTAKEGASIEEDGPTTFAEMTKPQLKDECELRGLPVGGNKADLLERLETS